MRDRSPRSPEIRRQARAHWRADPSAPPFAYSVEIIRRVAIGVYSDGFIHAGNLAYLSLVALFPFFVVAASVASLFGETQLGLKAVNAFLLAVPPNVGDALREPIRAVLSARSSSGIVWLGVLVGLWTTTSLIETIRDILRRAYGTPGGRPFWQYRLHSIGAIIASVVVTMFAFSVQIAMTGIDELLRRFLPFADEAIRIVSATKVVPMAVVTAALYALFLSLTPDAYRGRAYPKWPGAVLTALWWYGTLMLLPFALAHFATYDLTYGSLAGVMVTLIFFFLVGLGVVIGAELNAALAEFPDEASVVTDEIREETDA